MKSNSGVQEISSKSSGSSCSLCDLIWTGSIFHQRLSGVILKRQYNGRAADIRTLKPLHGVPRAVAANELLCLAIMYSHIGVTNIVSSPMITAIITCHDDRYPYHLMLHVFCWSKWLCSNRPRENIIWLWVCEYVYVYSCIIAFCTGLFFFPLCDERRRRVFRQAC